MSIEALFTYTFLFISLYFEVFLLVSFLERRSRQRILQTVEIAMLPTVAIAVPCFNERQGVAETLRSLLALEYPADKLQIIAVDDGSTDDTLAVLQSFANDSRIRIFSKENGGKHSAMNLALANTDAEFIGCLDADSVVASDALLRMMPVFRTHASQPLLPVSTLRLRRICCSTCSTSNTV